MAATISEESLESARIFTDRVFCDEFHLEREMKRTVEFGNASRDVDKFARAIRLKRV